MRGPLDEKDVPKWQEARRTRDLFLIEMVLAMMLDMHAGIDKIWLASMITQDLVPPKRWQISHDIDAAAAHLVTKPLRPLIKMAEDERAWFTKHDRRMPRTKQEYRVANQLLGPLVKALGYKSLKHFETAFDQGPA